MSTVVGFTPITKSEKRDDGTLVITGKVASSAVDRDYQIADPGWLGKSLGKWFSEEDGGNIREQHDGKRAVGTALTYKTDDHEIEALIVDPVTIAKIENRVLKGFSWSARNGKVQVDKAAAGGRIVGGDIYEVSVVDRPANPECLFTIAKADSSGDLVEVENPELVEKAEPEISFTPTDLKKALDAIAAKKAAPAEPEPVAKADGDNADDAVEKKDFTDDKRAELADKGQALPDGSFPIENKADLGNAIKAYGRAKDPAAAKKHIIKRARALDAVDMLPEDWNVAKADGILAQIADMRPGHDIAKADDELGDIDNGQAAIAAIARLIIAEAQSLAEGNLNEIWDIRTLTDAACALQCFVDNERWEAIDAIVDEAMTTSAAKTETPVAEIQKTDSPPAADPEQLTDLIEKALAEATKPLQDELSLVKAELAQVKATPLPGGPARTRTTGHTAVAAKADGIRREIETLRTQVARTHDRTLRSGYAARLAAAEDRLSKVDG